VLTYRELGRAGDVEAARALFAAEHELSPYAADALASEHLVGWLAFDDERLVGAVLTRTMIAADGAECGGIDELLVSASHRSQGIGRWLLELAETYYRDTGAAGMQLTVRDENAAALHLYQSMGYNVVERRLRMWKRWRGG